MAILSLLSPGKCPIDGHSPSEVAKVNSTTSYERDREAPLTTRGYLGLSQKGRYPIL